MSRTIVLAAVAAAGIVAGTPVAAAEVQPGLWEVTGQVERDGTVTERRPRLRCVSPEMARTAAADGDLDLGAGARVMLNDRFGPDACRLTRDRSGDRLIGWRLTCAGDPGAEQEGTVRFESPRHYTVTVRTSMTSGDRKATSVVTVVGRHKGECPR